MDRMVGEAYILMRGDGTLLKRDFQKAGHEAGEEYSKAFDDELRNSENVTLRRFRRNLADSTAEVDFSRFRREFGSVEKTFDGLNRELIEMRRSGSLTEVQLKRVQRELLEWAEAENEVELATRRLNNQQSSLRQFFRDQEEGLRRLNRAERERLSVIDASNRAYASYGRNILFSSERQQRALEDQDRAFRSYADNIRTSIERRAEPAILRFGRRIDDLGDRFTVYGRRVGRAFGAGSRNNGLNLLGRSIGALVSGPMRLLVETVGRVSQVLGVMGRDFRLARLDGLGFAASLGQGLLGGLRAGLPALAALAAGIAALAIVLPTLTALLFSLVGALTAVVGAITLGLIASLVVLLPVLLSIVGAIGVLAVAFLRARHESTQVAKTVEKLKKTFKDFGDSVAETSNAVVEAFAGTAEKLLSQMTPFFVNMGEALAEVATHFGRLLDNPLVKNVITELSTVLPRVFENIGKGINNMLIGLLGFFAAILGPVENFSNTFATLGTRFREFATDPDGQNRIADWFETAWGAARSLWVILGNVVTILGKIFTAGTEGPGQGFLDYLVEVTEKFDKWLSMPEGKSALEDFFVRVEDFMKTAKDALEDFGEALDKLDTDKAAQDAQSFAEAMGSLATGINNAAGFLTGINIAFGTLWDIVTGGWTMSELFSFVGELIISSETVRTAISDMITGFESLKTWFTDNFNMADSWADTTLVKPFAWAYDQLFGHSYIPDIVNGFLEWIPQIPTIIVTALLGVGETLVAPFRNAAVSLLSILATLPSQILGFIVGIPGMISGALSSVISVLPQPFQDGINRARTALQAFPGQVLGFIRGIPGIISAALASVISVLPSPFQTGIARARAWLTTVGPTVRGYLVGIPGIVSAALSGLAGAFGGPFAAAYRVVSGWVSAIRGLISNIGAGISSAAARVRSLAGGQTAFARGGVVFGPTNALIGEAGREAVVPLDRPLNMVDPSVRWLSAIAQGMKVPAMAAGGVAGGGRQIDVTVEQGAVQVVTKTTSPNVVGSIVLDGIADAIYTAVNG
ncbi:MAG TPA: hypothetical protein PK478_00585 [Nitrospira sp.]|nr:hypothetical protein [Nitrospira sp.]